MNVSLVSASDPQLEELLRACGARVTIVNADKLGDLAEASARQPDVLVVDQRNPTAMPAALVMIRRQHATTPILMVLPRLDPSLMVEAMRAGVNECLADPVTQEDLQAVLRRIAAARPRAEKGRVFAVIGAKGGVGATTVAVNLATMLAKVRPASTLLLDLHLACGDASVFLGAEPRFTVADALEHVHRLDPVFLRSLITHTKSGVQLLASPDRPVARAASTAHIRALIELAASEFPYVVLDLPRSDVAVLDALEPAGHIVVVANQELTTVRSASRMSAALQQRYGAERVSVAMTRYDEGADIGRRDVERVVGRPVRHLFPNNYQIALASLNKGRPLVLDNHSKLASAFNTFARSLADLPAERSDTNASSGLLGLIGRRR
jgi:pilus assembly protein CpaE